MNNKYSVHPGRLIASCITSRHHLWGCHESQGGHNDDELLGERDEQQVQCAPR